jgi:hypothetical protein
VSKGADFVVKPVREGELSRPGSATIPAHCSLNNTAIPLFCPFAQEIVLKGLKILKIPAASRKIR